MISQFHTLPVAQEDARVWANRKQQTTYIVAAHGKFFVQFFLCCGEVALETFQPAQ